MNGVYQIPSYIVKGQETWPIPRVVRLCFLDSLIVLDISMVQSVFRKHKNVVPLKETGVVLHPYFSS